MKTLICLALCTGSAAFQLPSSQLINMQQQERLIFATISTVEEPTTFDETVQNDTEEEEPAEQFNWFKAWHPIVPVDCLDNEKPHAFKVLGLDIVIWNDGAVPDASFASRKERPKGAKKMDGTWRAFVDQCPHTKVPLSEGRVEDDGSLLCSYHAWRFNGEGETIDVPQIPRTELGKIKANPKSNCNSFPVKIIDGVLWVWPDSSDDSRIEAALTPVPAETLPFGGEDDERVWKGKWNFRELPYGHDYFIENVVDPAHVPVSHHNVVGSRYGDHSMTINTKESLTKKGFSIGVSSKNVEGESTTTFNSPSQVLIKAPFGSDGAAQYLELYSSPSRPGFCNHVGRIVVLKDLVNEMPPLLRQFTLPLPIWLNHVLASAFLHQDALFLHNQERSLTNYGQYRTSQPANDSYANAILPCSADKGVMNFRNWMSKFAGGYIPFKGVTTMPAANNEVVFDVWNSHTKHCKHCLTALKRFKKARVLAFMMSALLATIRPKVFGVVGSTLGALACSGLGLGLTKLIGMFYKYEFSHADNH